MFYKSSRSTLINTVTKYLNFPSSASKLESIACKFTKSRTPSEILFVEFQYKCRTAILKNSLRWLLMGDIPQWLLLKDSCKDIFRNSRLHMFYISYSDVCERGTNFY